jgi:hypothetical protein
MPLELVKSDLARGDLVKIIAAESPPGIAGRWFIDRLKQGTKIATLEHVQPRRRKRGSIHLQ